MKKQTTYPGIKLLITDVPAEVIGVSTRTMQRRRKEPGSLTLDEITKIIDYKSAQGQTPIELSRKLVREDLKL